MVVMSGVKGKEELWRQIFIYLKFMKKITGIKILSDSINP